MVGTCQEGQMAANRCCRKGLRYETSFPVYCEGMGYYTAKNIGNRGVFVEGLEAVSPGDRLLIKFRLPGWDHGYQLTAEVTHRRGLQTLMGAVPGCGLKFVGAYLGNTALKRTLLSYLYR